MKKLSLMLGLLFMVSATPAQQYPWRELTYQEALQQAESKLVLLEFYTDW